MCIPTHESFLLIYFVDDDIIIIEEQDIQQEVILETTTDQSEAQGVTSALSVNVISECKGSLDLADEVFKDNLDHNIIRSSIAEPSWQNINHVEETVSSRETEILPNSSHSEISHIKASEEAASQTQRNRLLKPRPNLVRTSRPMKTQKKITSPQKVTSVISQATSVKGTTEANIVQSDVLMEDTEDIQKVSAHSPVAASQPEWEEKSLTFAERKVFMKGEERKLEKGDVSDVMVFLHEENVEARKDRLQQQPHR